MELAAFVTFIWSVIVLTQAEGSHDSGISARFILQDLVSQVPYHMMKQECILCKCYNQCHSGAFEVDQNTLCQDHYANINCSGVDRCTCCNDLVLWKPCQNGGRCNNLGQGDFNCSCLYQYYGPKCEYKDGCVGLRMCGFTGVCHRQVYYPYYHCTCHDGHFGERCNYNACSLNLCNHGGMCMYLNQYPYFNCRCADGYSGKTCDDMIPVWTQWYYGPCSVSCGNGTVVRIRKCSTGNDGDCAGTSMERTTCTEKSC